MRWKLAVAGVAVLAALIGADRMRRYVKEDPRFCLTCHKASPEFAMWTNKSHARITCQTCHHATTEQGVAMLSAFVAGKHAPLELGTCSGCHVSHDKLWVDISASRGHKVHEKIECIRCHGAAMHANEPLVAACKDCHKDRVVKTQGMQKLHCFACHDFLSVESDLRPSRRDCLRCHRLQGLDAAPMQFACSKCHKPHSDERAGCGSCHQLKTAIHRTHHAECATCHKPHVWRIEEGVCFTCHRGT